MKKLLKISAALLLILAFSISALMYLGFDIAQFHFKMEAERDIKTQEHLQTIKLSLKEFNNRDGDDELWVNGNLYDINSYIIVNDTAFISVFHDQQEEGLIYKIAESFEPNDIYSSDNTVHVTKHRIHVPDDSKILAARYTLDFNEMIGRHQPVLTLASNYCNVSVSVIKPPPRSASI